MIDYATLHELISYDPETGFFTWRARPRHYFSNIRSFRAWNSRYAGLRAGCSYINACGVQYWRIGIFGRSYQAHRLAWLYMTGEWPSGDVDHQDVNGINNQWGNLREATSSQNKANTCRRSTNTSGFKGVSKFRLKFRAQIQVKGTTHHLGMFETADDAHAAYVAAAREYFGEYMRAD